MSESITLSFRVTAERAAALERLARSTDRPRSWHLERAVERYLDDEAWQVAHMEQGLAELGRGEGVAHSEVAEWLAAWGSDEESGPPR